MNKVHILKNNLTTLRNYRRQKVRQETLPTYFWLEPTNHCNLRCIMCPNGSGKIEIEKGYMDYDFYQEIIDQISRHASAITLAVGGESLLHPNFLEMARYATDKGIKVLLNTNATLLDEAKADLLLESGISSISFAFDGFTKTMYEKARVGANFEKTIANILNFLRLKKQKGYNRPYTVLSILKLDLEECSDEKKKAFARQFDGLIDEIRLRDVSTWGNTFKDSDKFSFMKNVVTYPPCSRIWSTAVITWNGNVVPCIYNANHEYVIGNLNKNSFQEIWNSERMIALRQSMLNGSYLELSPLCEHCIVLLTEPLLGIPSGLRLALADAATNIFGYRFEKFAIKLANKLRHGDFSSVTIND